MRSVRYTYENVPRVELHEPEEGGDEGGLARPCPPHNTHPLPAPGGQYSTVRFSQSVSHVNQRAYDGKKGEVSSL